MIRFLLIFCLFSTPIFGQSLGKVGLKASFVIPDAPLSNYVTTGKGLSLQFNSTYFFQVRGRFSIDYIKYSPLDSAFQTYMKYGGDILPASLQYTKYSTIDVNYGMDFNPFKSKIPEIYFGPQVFMGADAGSYIEKDFINGTDNDNGVFFHVGYKFHLGYEKKVGKITFFGEYTFSKVAYTDNINIPTYYFNPTTQYNRHQMGIGIRF
ncbi:MAG: hypothetical protein RL207_2110 [Bacteroidota bacterium]|jgi:hypothetical protein